ncbi:DUF6350 family protein [Planococcus sp. APC 4015]|nr:DUF6350 family protein [Planococcus sp. APC 4015]
MHRLIVVILAAVDAAIATAVGLAAILAPLTLVWVLVFGGTADWGALWPASATIWQFGHAVPLAVTVPGEYLVATGIDPAVASFTLSLAPLALGAFTAIFAARSGRRASQADAWITGVVTGSVLFTAFALLIALWGGAVVAQVERWQAVLFPALFFAVPALLGAVVTEWSEAAEGGIARVRDRIEDARDGWGDVPALVVRGGAVVVVGLIGLAAVGTAVAVILGGADMIALFQSANVDAFGATAVTLAQLAYLPTVVIWALSFIAGPGFALGAGTSVSPAGTQVGPLPGIPILGAVPESTTPWLLLLALLPVALGVFAGWITRSRLLSAPMAPVTEGEGDLARTAALDGLLTGTYVRVPETGTAEADRTPSDAMAPRLVVTAGIAVVSASVVALLAVLASGSLGPGTLVQVGPAPGPLALAVGLEVAVGAAIVLLAPRRRQSRDADGFAVDPDRAAYVPPLD